MLQIVQCSPIILGVSNTVEVPRKYKNVHWLKSLLQIKRGCNAPWRIYQSAPTSLEHFNDIFRVAGLSIPTVKFLCWLDLSGCELLRAYMALVMFVFLSFCEYKDSLLC